MPPAGGDRDPPMRGASHQVPPVGAKVPPYCAETPLLSIRVMIECDFSMYLPVFLQSFVDLIQRQAMVVYRDVEMCAGVVAQT